MSDCSCPCDLSCASTILHFTCRFLLRQMSGPDGELVYFEIYGAMLTSYLVAGRPGRLRISTLSKTLLLSPQQTWPSELGMEAFTRYNSLDQSCFFQVRGLLSISLSALSVHYLSFDAGWVRSISLLRF